MGNRPMLAGKPTVEIDLERYDELLCAEVKSKQYKEALLKKYPDFVETIEAMKLPKRPEVGFGLDSYDEWDECGECNGMDTCACPDCNIMKEKESELKQ